MEYKIIYQNGPIYFEVKALNEAERKEAIKGIVYGMKDLYEANLLGYAQTSESGPVCDVSEQVNNDIPRVELATDGQIKYMAKLGIIYPANCTKIQAMDLINEYKIARGIPVNKKI